MKIYSEKLEEIRERVKDNILDESTEVGQLVYELSEVSQYVLKLEEENERLKRQLEIEKEHTREWKIMAQRKY